MGMGEVHVLQGRNRYRLPGHAATGRLQPGLFRPSLVTIHRLTEKILFQQRMIRDLVDVHAVSPYRTTDDLENARQPARTGCASGSDRMACPNAGTRSR